MLDSSVLGGLPKSASKGVILVILLGISLIDSIMADTFSASVLLSHIGSNISDPNLRFMVFINRSTMPVALWS